MFNKPARKVENVLSSPEWHDAVSLLSETGRSGDIGKMAEATTVFNGLCKPASKGQVYRDFVLGHLPPDVLAYYCEMGQVPWGDALAAKAAADDTAGLQAFYRLSEENLRSQDKDKALQSAVIVREENDFKTDILMDRTYQYAVGGKAGNAEYLLDRGARVSADGGRLLLRSVEQGHLALVMLLVQKGDISREALLLAAARAVEKKRDTINFFLKAQLRHQEKFMRTGEQILIENLDVDHRGGRLKTVFNFESRRVTEIFENAEEKLAAISSYPFDEADPEKLQGAFDRLVSLGGKPSALPERKARRTVEMKK